MFDSALIHCFASLSEVGSYLSEELQTFNNMYGKEFGGNIVAGEGEGVVPPCLALHLQKPSSRLRMYVQVLTISRTPINVHPFHRLYLHRQITADVRKRRASVVDANNTSEIMVAGGW